MDSKVIIESRDVELFENLTTSGKNSHVSTNEDSRDESSSKVVEKQKDHWKNKRV